MKTIFRREKFWDVIVASGTTTTITTTIGATKAITTSFSLFSMLTQPSTKAKVFPLQHQKNKAMTIFLFRLKLISYFSY